MSPNIQKQKAIRNILKNKFSKTMKKIFLSLKEKIEKKKKNNL